MYILIACECLLLMDHIISIKHMFGGGRRWIWIAFYHVDFDLSLSSIPFLSSFTSFSLWYALLPFHLRLLFSADSPSFTSFHIFWHLLLLSDLAHSPHTLFIMLAPCSQLFFVIMISGGRMEFFSLNFRREDEKSASSFLKINNSRSTLVRQANNSTLLPGEVSFNPN